MKHQVKFYYVYLITNIVLNKQYVGSRICYKDKIENDIYWGSSKYLDKDYLIFGKENFTKEILRDDYENIIDMLIGESENIHKYNTFAPNGYNRYDPILRKGFYMAGYKHSEETLQKMRKPHIISEEGKQKMKKSKSEETKQKMKKPKSAQGRENIRLNQPDRHGKNNPMFDKTGY